MRRGLFQFLVLVVLLSQGVVGTLRGQMLCIHIGPCASHAIEPDGDHEQCTHHGCDHHDEGSSDPDPAGPRGSAVHSHQDCGCHIHMPVPRNPQSPPSPGSARLLAESGFAKCLWAVLPVTMVDPWASPDRGPCLARSADGSPDSRHAAALRALKTTRLIL